MQKVDLRKWKTIVIDFIILAANALLANPSFSTPSLNEETLKIQLKANAIYDITPPAIAHNATRTPAGVRYIKNGDFTPSCSLVYGTSPKDVIELISPEPGSNLPSCGSPVRSPVFFEKEETTFAIYEYSIEDPLKKFTKSFQIVKISPANVTVCANDEELLSYVEKTIKKQGLKKAFQNSVEKFGCK